MFPALPAPLVEAVDDRPATDARLFDDGVAPVVGRTTTGGVYLIGAEITISVDEEEVSEALFFGRSPV